MLEFLSQLAHIGNGDAAAYTQYTVADMAVLLARQNAENSARVVRLRQQQEQETHKVCADKRIMSLSCSSVFVIFVFCSSCV